ncbi:MAG: hypothetical protein E7166_05075 [Firmicutes bacterium]|nr:hypothetical protein [Bacillota bacterium]
MREAIGGTFLFNIMIVFIFFFTAFLAIAINYSQAFRIKNQVINYIEQYEGMNETSEEEIIEYINSSGYYRNVDCSCDNNDYVCLGNNDNTGSNVHLSSDSSRKAKGLCIKKLSNSNGDTYYRVTTFVSFNLPIVGEFLKLPVKGETKVITND